MLRVLLVFADGFDQIAIGAGLYFVQERWGGWLKARSWAALGLTLLGTSGCFYLFLNTSYENPQKYLFTPTLLALSCAFAILGGLHSSLFQTRWAQVLSWPGKLSYGCYLWHPSFIVLLMSLLVWMGGLQGLTVLFLTVFSFAYLSYRYYEMPVNRKIRSWFSVAPSTKG